MNDEPQQPVFPSYTPPTPAGVPLLSHIKQQAPLMKMMKNMLKPRLRTKMRSPKVNKWKKRHQFY